MPNPDFENFGGPSAKKKARKTVAAHMTEKNVNWAGLPGKTQGKDRSGGTKKLKQYPQSEGL